MTDYEFAIEHSVDYHRLTQEKLELFKNVMVGTKRHTSALRDLCVLYYMALRMSRVIDLSYKEVVGAYMELFDNFGVDFSHFVDECDSHLEGYLVSQRDSKHKDIGLLCTVYTGLYFGGHGSDNRFKLVSDILEDITLDEIYDSQFVPPVIMGLPAGVFMWRLGIAVLTVLFIIGLFNGTINLRGIFP